MPHLKKQNLIVQSEIDVWLDKGNLVWLVCQRIGVLFELRALRRAAAVLSN